MILNTSQELSLPWPSLSSSQLLHSSPVCQVSDSQKLVRKETAPASITVAMLCPWYSLVPASAGLWVSLRLVVPGLLGSVSRFPKTQGTEQASSTAFFSWRVLHISQKGSHQNCSHEQYQSSTSALLPTLAISVSGFDPSLSHSSYTPVVGLPTTLYSCIRCPTRGAAAVSCPLW